MKNADLWLTSRAVEGFNRSDFDFLSEQERQSLVQRAISAVYYGLFHLLTFEAARMLVTGKDLRWMMGRAFMHAEMKGACKSFARGSLPKKLGSVVIPPRLKVLAQTFVDLQQARHEADYNLATTFCRSEARNFLDLVEQAFKTGKS